MRNETVGARGRAGAIAAALVAIVCVLGLWRCAKDVEELIPFPCANDGTCPSGLACISGVGCTWAQIDALCSRGSVDCSRAGPAVYCTSLGACSTGCGAVDGGCGDGRDCTDGDGDGGVCVPDCTSTKTCPSGFECRPLYHDGLFGCVPSTAPIATCDAFSQAGLVTCGQANMVISCSGGGACPTNSNCDPPGRCTCDNGYVPVGCDGTVCNGNCTWPNYFCVPYDQTSSCGAAGWGPSEYRCSDGRAKTVWCNASDWGCQSFCAGNSGCDLSTQTCPLASEPKCTLGSPLPTCVAEIGTLGAGAPCTRDGGNDDCAHGLYCADGLLPGGGAACAPFCRLPGDCAPGSTCIGYQIGGNTRVGVCAATCQFFQASCGAGMACSENPDTRYAPVAYCRAIPASPGGVGAACEFDWQCGDEMTCFDNKCTANCDVSHPCAAGTCHRYYGSVLWNNAGWCQ